MILNHKDFLKYLSRSPKVSSTNKIGWSDPQMPSRIRVKIIWQLVVQSFCASIKINFQGIAYSIAQIKRLINTIRSLFLLGFIAVLQETNESCSTAVYSSLGHGDGLESKKKSNQWNMNSTKRCQAVICFLKLSLAPVLYSSVAVSYTHLTLPTIYSV